MSRCAAPSPRRRPADTGVRLRTDATTWVGLKAVLTAASVRSRLPNVLRVRVDQGPQLGRALTGLPFADRLRARAEAAPTWRKHVLRRSVAGSLNGTLRLGLPASGKRPLVGGQTDEHAEAAGVEIGAPSTPPSSSRSSSTSRMGGDRAGTAAGSPFSLSVRVFNQAKNP